MCSFYFVYKYLLENPGANDKNKISILEETEDLSLRNKKEDKKLDKLDKIIDSKVDFIFTDSEEGKIRYYNLDGGGFWMTSFDGSFKKKIVSDNFEDLKEVIWFEDGKKALIKSGDDFYFYTFDEGKNIIKRAKNMNWLNFGEEITYVFEDQKSRKKTLNVANPDGSNWKEISELKDANLKMKSIPRSSKTSFWLNPDSFVESRLNIISAGGVGLEELGDLKYGSDYLWSPEGNRFLRSYVTEKGGKSLILECCQAKEGSCKNLDFPTLASKCVWLKNNKEIICSEIRNLKEANVLPNDHRDKKFISKDFFWKINIESGEKNKIIEDKEVKVDVDARNLILSPKEDFLFFINGADNSLFRLKI